MKKLQTYFILLPLFLLALHFNTLAQNLLLDSLKGTWTMTEQYNNKSRVEAKGTIEFLEDGTFKSVGSYFGSSNGVYTTNESKSTVQIVLNNKTSEWTTSIQNHVMTMTRVSKKKTPRIRLVLASEEGENNARTSR